MSYNLFTRAMVVYGHSIEPEIPNKALIDWMNVHPDHRHLTSLELYLERLGVPRLVERRNLDAVSHRAANRVLQKARKKGLIRSVGRHWNLTDEGKHLIEEA